MKISDFKNEQELKKMKVVDIKKHIRQYNEHYKISGYSKLKKDEIIKMILKVQDKIKNASKPSAPKPSAPKPSAPKPNQRQIDMLNFRNRALLPLINEKGELQDKEGEKYLKSESDFIEKESRRLLIGATKQEKKAIQTLRRIFGVGIHYSQINKFDNYYGAVRNSIQLTNQDLKKANLPPITFKGT